MDDLGDHSHCFPCHKTRKRLLAKTPAGCITLESHALHTTYKHLEKQQPKSSSDGRNCHKNRNTEESPSKTMEMIPACWKRGFWKVWKDTGASFPAAAAFRRWGCRPSTSSYSPACLFCHESKRGTDCLQMPGSGKSKHRQKYKCFLENIGS